jgi:hypothetical protein
MVDNLEKETTGPYGFNPKTFIQQLLNDTNHFLLFKGGVGYSSTPLNKSYG